MVISKYWNQNSIGSLPDYFPPSLGTRLGYSERSTSRPSQSLLFTRVFLNSQSSWRDIMVISGTKTPDYFPPRRKVVMGTRLGNIVLQLTPVKHNLGAWLYLRAWEWSIVWLRCRGGAFYILCSCIQGQNKNKLYDRVYSYFGTSAWAYT